MKPSELLDSPEKWIKGQYARDDSGFAVEASSDAATKFCLRGALRRIYASESVYEKWLDATYSLTDAIVKLYPRFIGVCHFNDDPETTFEDVQKVLKEAGL